MKKIILLLFFPLLTLSQTDFYLGFGSITTFAQFKQNNDYIEKENIDFGLYYGNNLRLSNKFMTTLEVFYLNQKVVLNRYRSAKFELHQNIGFGIKPGFYSGKHSVHLSAGILGVYVFDQNGEGGQFDHFDESYYYGMDYNYDLSNKISCNLGVILSEFYSNSQYTNGELTEFAVFQFTLHYNIF
tara:strand:+ start:105 stop:659 length:555 start_codon:yes stop_codon:yes gene_type:complete